MRVQDQQRHGLLACSGPVAFSASPENRHGLSWIWPQGGCPSPVQPPTRGDLSREKVAPLAASPPSSWMEWARPSQGGHNHHLGGHVKPLEPHVALAKWSVLGGGRHSLGGRLQDSPGPRLPGGSLLGGARLVRTASGGSFTWQSLGNLRHLQGLTVRPQTRWGSLTPWVTVLGGH